MITEVYDALMAAGAPEDKARAAAQAVAQRDIAEVKASLLLVKWMIGFNLAFTLAVVWRVLT